MKALAHGLPQPAVPLVPKLSRRHFRKNAEMVERRAQPVTNSPRLNVEALAANDLIHQHATFADIESQEN